MFSFLTSFAFFFSFYPTCLPLVGPVIKWNSQLQVQKQSPIPIRVQLGKQSIGNEAGVGLHTAVCRGARPDTVMVTDGVGVRVRLEPPQKGSKG